MAVVAPVFFLSYRREDAGYAEALRVALAARFGADRVFKDVDSMPLGASWKDQVTGALDRSTHVLVLIGDGWMDGVDDRGRVGEHADPVVFELEQAFRRKLSVIPILVGGREMPAPEELPAALHRHDLLSLNAAHIRAESPGSDIQDLGERFAEQDQRSPVARTGLRRWSATPRLILVGVIAALVLVGGAVFWFAAVSDDGASKDNGQQSTAGGLDTPSEDGYPACVEPRGPDWHSIPLEDDPAAEIGNPGNSLAFEVIRAAWRTLDAHTWEVVLDTAMTNDTRRDLQQGSWYYDRLEVARRPFDLACISVADATFVRPDLIGDARVGFTVRCEPSGTVTLVMVGADTVAANPDTIELGGSEPGDC
jgi:hypothetical protein